MDFDRFEEVHGQSLIKVPADQLDGGTGENFGEDSNYAGELLYEMEEVLARDEIGVLIWAEHSVDAYFGSTATADSTIRAAVAITASGADPPVNVLNGSQASALEDASTGDFTAEIDKQQVGQVADGFVLDPDVIGRVLHAVGFGPITDGTNGVGGAGTAGKDWWEGAPVAEPVFDSRDDIQQGGAIEISNAADLAAHVDTTVRHVWGVMEDFF